MLQNKEGNMATSRVVALGKRLGGLKAGLTARIKAATNALSVANARTPPSDSAVEELHTWQGRIRESIAKIEEAYTDLMERDTEEKYDTHVTALETETNRASQILHEINQALQRSSRGRKERQGQRQDDQESEQNSQRRVKANDALKPFTLTRDHTPAEMRSWMRKFTSYYTSSNMDQASLAEQQAYLTALIDTHLETRIRDKVTAGTPIFREQDDTIETTCIELIEAEFAHKYPVLTGRYQFFNDKQMPGQLASDWVAKLRALGDEAELEEMTTEHLYIMRYVCGVSDAKLRGKFLKEKKPSLEMFNEIILQHEAVKQSEKVITTGDPTTIARQVRQGGGQDNNFTTHTQSGRKIPSIAEMKKQNRCTRCGLSTHKANDCYAINKDCNNCGIKGHLARVCQKPYGAKGPGDQNAKTQTRTKTRKVDSKTLMTDSSDSDSEIESTGTQNKVKARLVVTRRATHTAGDDRMQVTVERRGTSFQFNAVPNTGTSRTLIAQNIADANRLKLHSTKTQLRAANNTHMPCAGKCNVSLKYQGNVVKTKALVTDGLHNEILIGRPDLKELGVIPTCFPEAVRVRALTITDLSDEIKADFDDVFTDTLKKDPMSGPPMHIHLHDNPQPARTLVARQYPIHMTKAAKEVVKELKKTILEEVHEPTDWISPGFFVLKGDPIEKSAKKEGIATITVKDLRLVVDYTKLNKFVKRPVHTFPSAKEIMDRIPAGSRYFCKLDCTQGYHQIPLDEKSSKLTTFILPEGRFRFKRTPMGLNASSDEWCRRSHAVIQDIEGTLKIVDDILIKGTSLKELQERVTQVLSRCREHNVAISKKKFKIGTHMKFAGHLVSAEGVRPDPGTVAAIAQFPKPKDKTELRRFLGLANQLGSFHPDIAHLSANLRPLTSSTVKFTWLEDHHTDFERMKNTLTTSDSIVHYFNPSLPTELLTDASRLYGIGFALVQRGPDNKIRLISWGSRGLTPTESRYAVVEMECLAMQWAMKKCRHFLIGMHSFKVITDHRPLIGVFNKPLQDTTNPRLLAMRDKMSCFSFEINWVEGKIHLIADALSRAPAFQHAEDDNEDPTARLFCCRVTEDKRLQQLAQTAKDDEGYRLTIEAVEKGKNPRELPHEHPAKQLQSVWDQVSIQDGLLVVDGHKLFVPQKARKNILEKLHIPHCGITKTRQAAADLYYWPGMSTEIKNMIDTCELCQVTRPSQPQEKPTTRKADYPMEQVGVDLCQYRGKNFLIMVDRYSGFPFIHML